MRKGRASGFAAVERVGRSLPGVEVATAWGRPALKVGGRGFVCIASHSSAEPDTLVVMMDMTARDALLDEDADTYYLTDHYVGYPCVLVRLGRVTPEALRDLVTGAYRYVLTQVTRKRTPQSAQSRPRGVNRRGTPR